MIMLIQLVVPSFASTGHARMVMILSNLLSPRSLLSHRLRGSIEDAARDGPCAHGNDYARVFLEIRNPD